MDEPTNSRAGMLRAFLSAHDEPCPACGYNLRGLTGEACPECGEALRLRVGMVEPRMRLYLAGLVGLASGAGFCGLLLVYAAYSLAVGLWVPGGRTLGALVGGLLVCGGAMGLWLRHRAAVRHWAPVLRAGAVAACWAVSVASAFVFFATRP